MLYNTTNKDAICKYYINVACDVYGQKTILRFNNDLF